MLAIELEHLSKHYDDKRVVDDLSLNIEHGTCLALLGPNGAGKTTTIKMTCGLIRPTHGTVRLMGHPITQRQAVMSHLGVVLEGARNIYWRLSPLNNLHYFANLKGIRITPPVKARMEQLLRDLDLWDRRHHEVREFSRGMQQKVAIACALVANPDIVLLDEPTLGLDAQAYQAILSFVRQLAQSGKTVLVTSHDFDFIRDIAERVVVMKQHIIFDGTPQDLAEQYGGRHRLIVTGFKPEYEAQFPAWRIRYDDEQTILIGDGEIYPTIAQLGALGCTLHQAEEVSMNADVFLQLIEGQNA